MDSRQESKLNMYRLVQQVCNDNQNITAANVAFTNAFNAFAAKVSAIISTATAEKEVITGVAAGKKEAKENLCQTASDLASIIFAFASATGNKVLKQQADYSVSDLKKLKDNELPLVCSNILKAAQDNSAPLADYGVTSAMLTAFQNNMNDYSSAVPKPQNAKSVKSTYTQNLVTLIRETDAILKEQLDKLIVSFKAASPDFVASYKNSRNIIDAPGHKAKPKDEKASAPAA